MSRRDSQGISRHRRVWVRPAVRDSGVPPDIRRAEHAGETGIEPSGPSGDPVATRIEKDRDMIAVGDLADELTAFREYLRAERGMAENTVIAYGHDLGRFAEWVALRRICDFRKPTLGGLGDYICFLRYVHLAPGGEAR